MTKKQALAILIENAAENVAGVGCGIRPEVSEERTMRVRWAVVRLYPDAYGRSADENDLRGLRLPTWAAVAAAGAAKE